MTIVCLLGLLFFSIAAATPPPSAREVLVSAGVPPQKLSQLDRGEIISHGIQEATEKELSMSVAMYLPVHQDKIIDYIKQVELFAIDSDVTAYDIIPNNDNSNDFKVFSFPSKLIDELLDLLTTGDDDAFNLSSPELSSILVLQNPLGNPDKHTLVKKLTQKYREILQQRWLAYKKSGLKGIGDYTRDDGAVSPAAELKLSTKSCKVLTRYFPELSDGWNNYPALLPADIEEHFYWINRQVENRPTAILAHSVLQVSKFGALIIGRQFYVGHSYNSNHMCVGILPYRDGALVYYIESTSTDQVAGITAELRHMIGREQLKVQMLKHIEKLGKSFGLISAKD